MVSIPLTPTCRLNLMSPVAFDERTIEAMPAWEALLMVYAIFLIPTAFTALVGLNLLVWAKSRINYVFIFGEVRSPNR